MNANDATLTEVATAQTGSMVHDDAPNAPAGSGLRPDHRQPAVSARVLHQAFDAASGWKLSGTGPDYACAQTFPTTVPGGPGSPLAGYTLQFVASLISPGAQIVTIRHSDPFVLV